MRILLLGGSGFFGKSFIDYFQKNVFQNNSNYKLILASRNIDKVKNLVYSKFIDKKIFLENLDVTKCTYLPEVDLIIHAANSTSEKDYINNIENEKQNIINGTENILNIIKKNTNFIYISSGAVYGRQENISKGFSEDESMVSSLEGSKFHYAAAKAEAESIVIKYSKNNSINSVIARCFAFVGKHLPLDSHFYIGNMIKSILNKEDHQIKYPNKVFRSYIHSDDLVIELLFLNTFASSNCEILILDLMKFVSFMS